LASSYWLTRSCTWDCLLCKPHVDHNKQLALRNRPNWSRLLPQPLVIPKVMKLTTLADVRELMRHLPKGHRARSTWQHVEKQLNAAALSEVETIDVAVPLRLVLQLERVPCLPQ